MASALFRFYEELNDFLPANRRKRDVPVEFREPCPVRHLVETFGVPHTEVEIILVNGRSVGLEERVRDGGALGRDLIREKRRAEAIPILRELATDPRAPRHIRDNARKLLR